MSHFRGGMCANPWRMHAPAFYVHQKSKKSLLPWTGILYICGCAFSCPIDVEERAILCATMHERTCEEMERLHLCDYSDDRTRFTY